MKYKAKQIAQDLGISPATVSLAINDKPGVNKQTRQKVLDYIAELSSNEAAADAERPATGNIRLIYYASDARTYGDEEKNLFSVFYTEMYRMIHEHGYNLNLVYASTKADLQEAAASAHDPATAALIIDADSMSQDELKPFKNLAVPVILLDNIFEEGSGNSILINNYQGIRDGLRYLQQHGHKEVLYIRNSYDLHNFLSRRSAFALYYEKFGFIPLDQPVLDAGTKIDEIYFTLREYIQNGGHLPSAVFSENYVTSIGTIKALQDCGYRIPEDISVIAIDELPASALLNLDLTCFKVHHTQKARMTVARLMDMIGHPETNCTPVELSVGVELVRGSSVATLLSD